MISTYLLEVWIIMPEFIYPLATLVLDFFCALFCIRLAASKRGPVWLIPMLLSLFLMLGSLVCLLATVSSSSTPTFSTIASYLAVFLFILSFIWLVTMIAFVKRTKPNRMIAEDEKAFNEAEYIRKRTEEKIKLQVDKRATATHKVTKTDSLKAARAALDTGEELYDFGEVATVRPRRTSYSRG